MIRPTRSLLDLDALQAALHHRSPSFPTERDRIAFTAEKTENIGVL